MEIKYASLSNKGERDYNEDSIGCFKRIDGCCFVLADGLGGHGKGEVASQTVVETVENIYNSKDETIKDFEISEMFEKSQDNVLQIQKENNDTHSMKTTMTIAMIKENKLEWGHIGDSRIYIFKKNKFLKRTLDHSVPQMLVSAGEIKETQIRGHIDRNKLLRVVGVNWDTPRYQIGDGLELEGNEAILLCSDGFWEFIEDKQIVKTLKSSDTPEKWIEQMENIVLKNGTGKNMDNYSAICAFIK